MISFVTNTGASDRTYHIAAGMDCFAFRTSHIGVVKVLTANWLGSPSEFMKMPNVSSQVPRSAKYLMWKSVMGVGWSNGYAQKCANHYEDHDYKKCKREQRMLEMVANRELREDLVREAKFESELARLAKRDGASFEGVFKDKGELWGA